MATTKLAIHIRPGANPSSIKEMVALLSQKHQHSFETTRRLLEYTESQGLGSYAELKSVAVDMGLLDELPDRICLSQTGFALARLRENVQADILHYLIYTGWKEKDPLNFLPSWAYRLCCDRYWDAQNVLLNVEYLNRQVEETISQARSAFLQMGIEEFQEISFSRKSLEGAKKWLDALQPPVIENATFTRRAFCSPELLLLAIGYVVHDEAGVVGIDILLSREKRDRICKICLLDPNALDRTLDWMIPIFPALIASGTSAGFYGRFIRFHKLPTLEDIVR